MSAKSAESAGHFKHNPELESFENLSFSLRFSAESAESANLQNLQIQIG
jgi:hypothetical protein